MKETVTIHDIARYASVGVGTVSRVINNHPDVSDKTREKVLAVIQEHGYIPNNSARSLKRDAIQGIGVIIRGFTNPFFVAMLEVIQKELREQDYIMFIEPIDTMRETNEVEAAISLVKEKKLQGALFLGGELQAHAQQLSLLDVPYVTVTTTVEHGVDPASFSSVRVDDYLEGRRIGLRILEAGHRDIAVVGFRTATQPVSGRRIIGFLSAMEEYGVVVQEGFLDSDKDFSVSAGYAAAQKTLQQTQSSCMFCMSDTIALGAIRAVHDYGLTIPDDVSIVGFDGIIETQYSIPTIATVRQPGEQMARTSVRFLLERIRNKAKNQHVILEAEFLPGESFGKKKIR